MSIEKRLQATVKSFGLESVFVKKIRVEHGMTIDGSVVSMYTAREESCLRKGGDIRITMRWSRL
jgi:hypothetical protein